MTNKIPVFKFATAVRDLDKAHADGMKGEFTKHHALITDLCKLLPSGDGIGEYGVQFEWTESNSEKLIFYFTYLHHDPNLKPIEMTDHHVVITPTLVGGYKLECFGNDPFNVNEKLQKRFSDVFIAE